MSTLERQLRPAFDQFAVELHEDAPFARENELVSLFAFGPLLRAIGPSAALFDPRQIGLEVAVPQLLRRPGGKAMVRKDLVIWRRPGQTAWTSTGAIGDSPLAVLEWKGGRGTSRQRIAQREHDHDLSFLHAVTSSGETEGYLVRASFGESGWSLRVGRVHAGKSEPNWFPLERG